MIRALLHSADDLIDSNGAWSILALDGILLIPLVFAAFFYPIAILVGVGAAAVLTLVALAVMKAVHAHHHRHRVL